MNAVAIKTQEVMENTNNQELQQLSDCITYDKATRSFMFDLSQDGKANNFKLRNVVFDSGTYDNTKFFGYEVEPYIEKEARKNLINLIMHSDKLKREGFTKFIRKIGTDFDRAFNLAGYDVFVVSESQSKLSFEIEKHFSRLAFPRYVKFDEVKSLPADISFDFNAFENEVLSKYPDDAKRRISDTINSLMEKIRNLESLPIDAKAELENLHVKDYFRFKAQDEKEAFEKLSGLNAIVFDDVMTDEATIDNILKIIRLFNTSNKVTVFSMMGDCMIDNNPSDEWTVDGIRCRRMASKRERETLNYLLRQDGARPSGKGEMFYTQLDE